MERRIRTRLERAVSENLFPGSVVGAFVGNAEQIVVPVGYQTYENNRAIEDETVFDVASITKAIPVSSLALKLIDDGHLDLHERVDVFVPELNTNYNAELTIRHLLTHTADFRLPLSSLKHTSAIEILNSIYATQFETPPGDRMMYSNASSILLGLVIERLTEYSLDQLADDAFFTPLGMKSTTFHPEHLDRSRIVPTEDDQWRGRVVHGEVHDESAYVLREKIIPGSAGIFSTAPDLLKFLQMVTHDGVYDGERFFTDEMIQQMMVNQLEDIGEYGSLGWELYQPRFMGNYATEQTIGKTGFTGCMVVCDIPRKIGIVLLSNYHYPNRRKSAKELNAVRRDIADIVFQNG